MNWNFSTANFSLRLPDANQDNDALYELLSQPGVMAHIPKASMSVSAQSLDELRRVAMRFEVRESACWLVEGSFDKQLIARVGVQKINWMTDSAQFWWELSDRIDFTILAEVIPAVMNFCFDELKLNRLEMRVVSGSILHEEYLKQIGFQYEGCLPAQQEFEGKTIDLALYSFLAGDRR
ncbi:MAG: GNAT family N-acetyltransferase [Saccharospirillaceae bacterium]|jgi:ribosomal-protein-alanine N-acetyltransferase|nr:GNAT family N-acetyltransferase [Saccharospirillaceae bacterium]